MRVHGAHYYFQTGVNRQDLLNEMQSENINLFQNTRPSFNKTFVVLFKVNYNQDD